jgi:hypothetical protein
MHKIAKSRAGTLPHFILATTCFPEVSHRTQLSINGSPPEPAIIQVIDSSFSILLSSKLNVDIANKMVPQIITHIHLFNFTILVLAFHKNIFEEVVIMFLHFLIGDVSHQVTSIS